MKKVMKLIKFERLVTQLCKEHPEMKLETLKKIVVMKVRPPVYGRSDE